MVVAEKNPPRSFFVKVGLRPGILLSLFEKEGLGEIDLKKENG